MITNPGMCSGRGECPALAFVGNKGLTPSDLLLVRRLPLFSALPMELLTSLLSGATVMQSGRGNSLFLQDDPADALCVVLDGWVKLSRLSAAGQEAIVGVFTRGESFGEAAIFGSGVYPVTAVSVTKVRLLHVPAKAFMEELKKNPTLCLSIMGSMSAHLRELVVQLERLTCGRAVERLAEFLHKLCDKKTGRAELTLPHDKSLIAARLGMQPETFSRCLGKLKSQGFLEVDDDRLIFPDVARLTDA